MQVYVAYRNGAWAIAAETGQQRWGRGGATHNQSALMGIRAGIQFCADAGGGEVVCNSQYAVNVVNGVWDGKGPNETLVDIAKHWLESSPGVSLVWVKDPFSRARQGLERA